MKKSYLESLQQSPQDKLQAELLYQVQEKKSCWEVSISKSKAAIARAEKDLADAYANADLHAIVEGTALVQSLEMGLEIAQAAFPVLFPAE